MMVIMMMMLMIIMMTLLTDSCSGDSGGPLMARTDKWYLTGLVSFGTNECDSSLPGVYTRVSFFLDWILETLRNT